MLSARCCRGDCGAAAAPRQMKQLLLLLQRFPWGRQAVLWLLSGFLSVHHAGAAESGFSPTGSMTKVRDFHTATLLPSGKVLAAAGFGADDIHNRAQNSAELYDTAAGKWGRRRRPSGSRRRHTATVFPGGVGLGRGGSDPKPHPPRRGGVCQPDAGTREPT